MTGVLRLAIAPRPRRDELLSSWLGRVACRYGLTSRALALHLAGGRWEGDIDRSPTRPVLQTLAAGVHPDPDRLQRLTLTECHPNRGPGWYGRDGPGGRAMAGAALRPAVCLACFDADHEAGGDAYLRRTWVLAERCTCPRHRRLLWDACPACSSRLLVSFILRDGCARPICSACKAVLTTCRLASSLPERPVSPSGLAFAA